MEELSKELGISQTSVLEQAIRRFAKAEGISLPRKDVPEKPVARGHRSSKS